MSGFRVQNAMRFPFAVHVAGGRIREEADYEEYIRQLIRQVLLTNPGERVNRPQFGCELRRLLFAPLNPAAATYVRTLVFQALTRWLSQFIRPERIEVRVNESRLDVEVEYTVIARGERRFLNVELSL
ncbi:GPW/gp25 family protein [Oceanicella sp. SM1341]|uniref:GPW/gp25 family protein n=1 Tax=Oceanicella sp. SM1341 TaxID=1548889 RepID=UPI0018E584AE|nr:GPW/gp25 family protein [Oceanicella sp. SM1341]